MGLLFLIDCIANNKLFCIKERMKKVYIVIENMIDTYITWNEALFYCQENSSNEFIISREIYLFNTLTMMWKKVENKLITSKYHVIFFYEIKIGTPSLYVSKRYIDSINVKNECDIFVMKKECDIFIKTRKSYFTTMLICNTISTEGYNLIFVMSCNLAYIICLSRMWALFYSFWWIIREYFST